MEKLETANFANLSSAVLVEHAIKRGEAWLSNTGALITNTKKYTGRSPKDKFTVCDDLTKNTVWFSDINKKMAPEHGVQLYEKIHRYLSSKPHYVVDCMAGASSPHAMKIRVVCERAWHALFVRNMFTDVPAALTSKDPDFYVFHAPGFLAEPSVDKTNSESCVVLDFSHRRIVIGGTEYAGEIKKSVFTVLNYLLPNKNVLSMHCSANVNAQGEGAIFFGLSGTGKTTLSADSSRSLIGDDEHGWDDHGVFNFEGGCYAKVINLSPKDEPEIFAACRRFTAILENVVFDEQTREVNLDDSRFTENTRASYDISFIPNVEKSGKSTHPKHIIMLTCDAFGVLPPIARLSADAAVYHFVNGYTAKVAGTERGVKEPEAVFSPCFGAPFMAHFPGVYAKILRQKIQDHRVQCWLVNTGWSGGPYGVGKRIEIAWTRALLHAALDGRLDNVRYVRHPIFNVDVPVEVPDVPQQILDAKNTWADKTAYEAEALKLARLFTENARPYSELLSAEVMKSGPIVTGS